MKRRTENNLREGLQWKSFLRFAKRLERKARPRASCGRAQERIQKKNLRGLPADCFASLAITSNYKIIMASP